MQYINCKQYVQDILDTIKEMPEKKKLVIFTVGENLASESYVKGKIKDCEYCGIPYEHIKFVDEGTTKAKLAREIELANRDDSVGGIIVQLPLPEGYDEKLFTDMVAKEKDVDGFRADSPFKPCTPEGIMYLLRKELGDLTGKNALVIGRGKLVGEPIAKMLLDANCTVTVAHSKTMSLHNLLHNYEIVVSAVGKPRTVALWHCWCAEAVVDCGVSRDENGKLVGDCFGFTEDWAVANPKVTPVPGGIGLLTRAMLMAHIAGLDLEE